MSIKMLLSNLHVIENYVAQEDVEVLLSFCKSFSDWNNMYDRCPDLSDIDVDVKYRHDVEEMLIAQNHSYWHPLVLKYQKKVEQYASAAYGRSLVTYHNMHLRKYSKGDNFNEHFDSEALDGGKVQRLPRYRSSDKVPAALIEVAINIYLNDEYTGGEIYFPDYEISVKPKPGQLIMFPGGHEFKHGVHTVTSGNRYTMASFLTTPKLLMLHAAAYNGASL
jgi:predicted 2-oxoglutarate/Fe(II)-dependent dioxygenase YbiX